MIYRGQIQGFVYKGFPEVRPSQFEVNFEPRAAQPVIIGIVHIEHEVERAAAQSQPGNVDLLQLDLRLLEGERIP